MKLKALLVAGVFLFLPGCAGVTTPGQLQTFVNANYCSGGYIVAATPGQPPTCINPNYYSGGYGGYPITTPGVMANELGVPHFGTTPSVGSIAVGSVAR